MPNILIRNVSPETVARLRERAKRHGTSLQAEALAALEAHGPYSGSAFAEKIKRFHAEGKLFPYDVKAALQGLSEDRDR